MARGLVTAGHVVHVYVTSFTGVTKDRDYEQHVSFGQLYGGESKHIRALRYFRGLLSSLWSAKRQGTGVVYLHAFQHDLREVAAIWGSRLLGMRVALTVHDIEAFGSQKSSLIRNLALGGANLLIFQNEFSKKAFEQQDGAAGRRTAIVAHGHYCDAYPDPLSRSEARRNLGLASDDFVFLFFGNPREEKGLDLLLRALGPLRDTPAWKLVVAGKLKPPQEAAVRQIISEAGLEDHVRLDPAHVPDEKVPDYYRASDIVVIPYRRIYESGVTIMAMSMGRAALVSDLEPLTEKIIPGETGLVFRCGDEAHLTVVLSEALERRGELDGFGERALAQVREGRNWITIGQSLSNAICGLFQGSGR